MLEMVYIRRADDRDIVDYDAQAHQKICVVCNLKGERMGLFSCESVAFVVARQEDYEPVWVH